MARKVNDNSSLKEIIKTIKDSAGNIEQENSFNADLINSIREDANSSYINNILIDSFNKAKSDTFKYILLWDILEYTNLSNEAHQQFFEFYLDNIALFSNMSKQWYKTQTDEAFFQTLKGRIETAKGYNQKKKWIYICDMYTVSQLQEVKLYLDQIENGKIEAVNFPLAKLAAKQIKEKVINAKQDSIHIA